MSVLDFHGMVPFLANPFAKSIATIPSTLGRDDICYVYIFSLIQQRVLHLFSFKTPILLDKKIRKKCKTRKYSLEPDIFYTCGH